MNLLHNGSKINVGLQRVGPKENSVIHHYDLRGLAEKLRCYNVQYELVVEDAAASIQDGHAGGFDTVGISEAISNRLTTYPIKPIQRLIL